MVAAIVTMTAMGLILGYGLAIASRIFHIDTDPVIDEITQIMPGTHCGQCGFAGCGAAAEAIADGSAQVSCCPPGGKKLAETIADILGITVDLDDMESVPLYASIKSESCTGCTRCYKACPTDAIVGANKQIHAVINAACTGCGKCVNSCPEDCIEMRPEPVVLENWHWPEPKVA